MWGYHEFICEHVHLANVIFMHENMHPAYLQMKNLHKFKPTFPWFHCKVKLFTYRLYFFFNSWENLQCYE